MSVYKCHAFIFLDQPPPWPSRTQRIYFEHTNFFAHRFLVMRGNDYVEFSCSLLLYQRRLTKWILFVSQKFCMFRETKMKAVLASFWEEWNNARQSKTKKLTKKKYPTEKKKKMNFFQAPNSGVCIFTGIFYWNYVYTGYLQLGMYI
jgi:hypothetical protein